MSRRATIPGSRNWMQLKRFLRSNLDYRGLKAFDVSYGGDLSQWLKLANSGRLLLAMRISKVAPAGVADVMQKLDSPNEIDTLALVGYRRFEFPLTLH